MYLREFMRLLRSYRYTIRYALLGASPLDPARLIALRALDIIHMLQADTSATPCSQPQRELMA